MSAATPTSGRFRTNQCAEALGGLQGKEPPFGVNGEERTQVKDGHEIDLIDGPTGRLDNRHTEHFNFCH